MYMNSSFYESKIFKLFSEIIYTDFNPHIIEYRETYKENGNIKTRRYFDEYKLESIKINKTSTNILIPECGNFGLIERIEEVSGMKEIDFHPKNIFQRLFKDKKINLFLELENITEDSYIITSKKIHDIITNKVRCEVYIEEKLYDRLVIGKRSKIIIKRNLIEEGDDYIFEYNFDKSQFSLIYLN